MVGGLYQLVHDGRRKDRQQLAGHHAALLVA